MRSATLVVGLALLLLFLMVGAGEGPAQAQQAPVTQADTADATANQTGQADTPGQANQTGQAILGNATEPVIKGAFGYVLGEVWDGAATPAEPGLLKAEVPPLIDSKLFDFHSLWLDPESKRIVQISASRAFEEPTLAERAHMALMGILTGKYGQPRDEQLRQVFGADGRSVHVLMSLEGETAMLGVVYQDDRATAAAITRPRFELKLPEIPGVNATGVSGF